MDGASEKFDSDKYFLENIEPYVKSKGVQKMWNYFLDISKKDYFNKTIIELRGKYGIPSDGFKVASGNFSIPPKEFNRSYGEELTDDIINKICKKYKLHYFDYSDIILFFTYYNFIQPMWDPASLGLFRVCDVILEKEEPFGELIQKSDDEAYPIAIRVSPYASQRDLVDFIQNKVVWKNQINFLQNKYKDKSVKIGRVKAKKQSIQERNQLIYNNRSKPLKDIRKLLAQQKIFLDDGHIAKIISLEKQHRKEA